LKFSQILLFDTKLKSCRLISVSSKEYRFD